MSLKRIVAAFAAFALCATAAAPPALAQGESCGDLYNRVMWLYQNAPQSAEYAQTSGYYTARCVGPSAGPAYPQPYQAPPQGYYQAPQPVDPTAAIVGGLITGAIIGGAIANDNDRHRRR